MGSVAPILPARGLPATLAFYVDDAEALHAEFLGLGLPGEGIPRLHGASEPTDYGLSEFAVVDRDGNLLRIASPLGR